MAEAMEKVLEMFRAKEWNVEADEENQIVRTGVEGDNGEWRIVVSASDKEEVCLILSVLPQKCPKHRRVACAELLTRINYGMLVGCFEMDFESGRIHFKTSQPFTSGQLDAELLGNVLGFNINRMDKHLPAIMSVIYSGTPPAKALAALERAEKAPKKPQKPRGAPRFLSN